MGLFWKTAAGVLIAVILILAIGKQEKDIGLLLSMAVCIMVGITAISLMEPVLDFFYRLEKLGDLHGEILTSLLKITGIGLVSELTQMICQDSGNAALAKAMQLLGAAVILSLAMPMLEAMMDLIIQILGAL